MFFVPLVLMIALATVTHIPGTVAWTCGWSMAFSLIVALIGRTGPRPG